jgi:hypothetical protein
MQAAISTSLTTGDTTAYVYPRAARRAAYADTARDAILYAFRLVPKPPAPPAGTAGDR